MSKSRNAWSSNMVEDVKKEKKTSLSIIRKSFGKPLKPFNGKIDIDKKSF